MARRASRVLLYGPDGRPVRVKASGWDASSQGRRAVNWQVTSGSINALLAGDVETLRNRSRDEIRRNPWAAKAMDAFVANAVGGGIRPKPQTENEEFRREILDAWNEWCDEADADGTSDFYGLQALACRSFHEGGDCFARFRPRRPKDGLSVPLQLQLLEAEMCDATRNEALPDGRVIRAGVEFNGVGQRKAYWMFRTHPGELVRRFSDFGEAIPVPAAQIAPIFRVLRPGQVRGIPGLAIVLAMLHEIRETDDAYIVRTKIQNLFATFEQTPEKDVSVFDSEGDDTDDEDIPMPAVEPASHYLLPPGHEIKFSEPPRDGLNYEAFLRGHLRAIAAGAGVTYEQVTGDLSGVNFSSIRAGLIEFRREMEQTQRNILIFQLCRRVWRRWFEAAVLSGRITIPEGESENVSRLLRPQWQSPGWEYVEPEKDVRAAVRRIRAGLSSRTREAAKLGMDVEELDREIAADIARASALGLTFDSDPSSDMDGSARGAALADPGDAGQEGEEGANQRENAA